MTGNERDSAEASEQPGPSRAAMRLALVLNSDSGTLRTCEPSAGEEIADIFRQAGHDVTLHWKAGKEAIAAIEAAFADDAYDAVIIGGGDGSVSFAASQAYQSGKVLGILPLGTMNLFARALGVPLDMYEAARVLAAGEVSRVDIADVNGRLFVHHVTLGLHPKMIRLRQELDYGSRFGKLMASAKALRLALRRPPIIRARLALADEEIDVETAALVVSNGPLGDGHLPYADDPCAETLGIYFATSRKWTDLLELAAAFALGRMSDNPILSMRRSQAVTISMQRSEARASVDGEVVTLRPPLKIQQYPRGLTVLAPAGHIAKDASGQ